MAKVIDLTGQRFGRLTVLRLSPVRSKSGSARWICKCDCGNDRTYGSGDLRGGGIKSCGCYRADLARETQASKFLKHGHCIASAGYNRTWSIWRDMTKRCRNRNCKSYPYYGGRGITVCKRWRDSFANFLEDMGECPDHLTIERKRVNGNYTKSNCCWANRFDQVHNRRPVSEWRARPGPKLGFKNTDESRKKKSEATKAVWAARRLILQ